MKRQKRRDVWHFARLIRSEACRQIERNDLNNDHAELAYCLLCSAKVKFRVGQSKLPQHMEIYHSEELKVYNTKAEQRNQSTGQAPLHNGKRQLRTISAEQQKRVNLLLAEWIARHFRPMKIVEDAGFVVFIRYITEDICGIKIRLPERTKIAQQIVALAVEYRKRVRHAIVKGCWYFSMTCDIWTSRNTKSYISLTIHYVDDEFCPQNWTLEVKELAGIHDGNAIADAIEQIMEEWQLSKLYCVRFLRDGGTNMVAAGELLHVEHMSCLAHCLHLVVGGAMIKKKRASGVADEPDWAAEVAAESSEPVVEHEEEASLTVDDRNQIEGFREVAIDDMEQFLNDTIELVHRNEMDRVREIVQRFRTLAVYFRKSAKGCNRLNALQIEHFSVKDHEVKKPIVDCATRWNSCWQMLQRMIELEGALVKFFTYLKNPEGIREFKDVARKLYRPTAEEWLTIKCLRALLGPFAVASETLGGQTYPTMPLVLPVLSGIRKHLEKTDLFASLAAEAGDEAYVAQTVLMVNDCRKGMLTLYVKRFEDLEKSELRWVAYLDPRVGKWMSHLSPIDKPNASNELVQAMVQLANETLPPERTDPRHQTPIEEAEQQQRNDMIHHLFGPNISRIAATDLETECKREFTRYLECIVTVKNDLNPFTWWKANGDDYPNLRRLARKWLGTVATSVPSERAFSTSGNVITVKRSSLKATMVRDLVFIAENWKCIDRLKCGGYSE